MFRRSTPRLTLFCCLALSGLACKSEVKGTSKPLRVADASVKAPFSVADGRGLLFSFFDQRATMRTVERIADIEKLARSQVMVIDPGSRLSGDRVHVADLRASAATPFPTWIEKRGSWLSRNMPKQSELDEVALAKLAINKPAPKKRRRIRRRIKRRRRLAAKAKAKVAEPSQASKALASPTRVVMFSTAWCPACKSARAYFAQKKIPILDLDVEKDRMAAQRFMAIQQRLNLKRGAIPLIIINGRVLQGFSKPQVEAALAQAPAKRPG